MHIFSPSTQTIQMNDQPVSDMIASFESELSKSAPAVLEADKDPQVPAFRIAFQVLPTTLQSVKFRTDRLGRNTLSGHTRKCCGGVTTGLI